MQHVRRRHQQFMWQRMPVLATQVRRGPFLGGRTATDSMRRILPSAEGCPFRRLGPYAGVLLQCATQIVYGEKMAEDFEERVIAERSYRDEEGGVNRTAHASLSGRGGVVLCSEGDGKTGWSPVFFPLAGWTPCKQSGLRSTSWTPWFPSDRMRRARGSRACFRPMALVATAGCGAGGAPRTRARGRAHARRCCSR